MTVTVLHGDMLAILPTLAADSIDSAVTDPPYELGFMSKRWDKTGVAFRPETWAEVLRVLKPGAHLLAFGAPRGWHRMVSAIEDAGFEIRDDIANLHDGALGGPLMWAFASGFPKSHDVSKGIDRAAGATREVVGSKLGRPGMAKDGSNQRSGFDDAFGGSAAGNLSTDITAPATPEAAQWAGWGTSLKPAWEGITVARKPLAGTVVANVLAYGTGALNIDGCRVPGWSESDMKNMAVSSRGNCRDEGHVGDFGFKKQDNLPANSLGRWPANLCHDGSDEVLEAFAAYGEKGGGHDPQRGKGQPFGGANTSERVERNWKDVGTAARFFMSAKAGPDDRMDSKHPTVKPLALMRWLVRLVTPPGGTVLDPFAGSGTTGMAAMAEGFNAVLVEREAEYVADIRRRMAHVRGADTPLFAGVA